MNSFGTQETLEDIDKNGDGHVDEDEYIGKFEWFNWWIWVYLKYDNESKPV